MSRLDKIITSKSKTFLAFCFCFIAGVALAAWLGLEKNQLKYFFVFIAINFFALGFFWPNVRHRLMTLAVLIFFLGAIRFIYSLPTPSKFIGQKNIYTGQIVGEPKITSARGEYAVKNNFSEKWLLYLPPYPRYSSGAKLVFSCLPEKLRVSNSESANYQKTLDVQHITAICYTPNIVTSTWPGRLNFWANIYGVKNKISERVGELWSEPGASLVGGILYGDRRTPDKNLTDDFTRVGLVHIVAVSGYNITIIASTLMFMLIFFGLNRRRAFWWAIFGVALFVIFTGAADSAVRAGLMSSTVLFGQYLGRRSAGFVTLIFTAVVMIFINPLILPWSIGFQLSFVATFGLMYLSRDDQVWQTTLAATLATTPIILFHFGRLSLVSLPVNILVLWIIPYLMLGSFLALIMSYIFWPLATVLAWLTHFGLQYLLLVVKIFARQTWSVAALSFSGLMVVIVYVLIIKYALWQNKK